MKHDRRLTPITAPHRRYVPSKTLTGTGERRHAYVSSLDTNIKVRFHAVVQVQER